MNTVPFPFEQKGFKHSRTRYSSFFKWRNPRIWNYSSCHNSHFRISYDDQEGVLVLTCDKCQRGCYRIAVLPPLREVNYPDFTVSYQVRGDKLLFRLVANDMEELVKNYWKPARLATDLNPVFVPRKRERLSWDVVPEFFSWVYSLIWERL
jgi:hypothetical protein